jgi:HlyD family secretion protein
MKRRTICSLLFLLLGLSAAGCLERADDPLVTTATVQEGCALPISIKGIVAARSNVTVVPKISGRVAVVNVEMGQEVHQGEVLMCLEDQEIRNQVQQAEAGLAAAKARLAEAKAGARPQELAKINSGINSLEAVLKISQQNYERTRALYEQGAVSQQQLESAEVSLTKARNDLASLQEDLRLAEAGAKPQTIEALQAGVQQAAAALALAGTQLDNTMLRAPLWGQIAQRNLDPGEMASPTMPAFTIVDVNKVILEGFVAQEVVGRVQVGSSVRATTEALPGRSWQGKVVAVSPVASAGSQRFPVKVMIDNPNKELKPGMPAVAELKINPVGGAVMVPDSAIVSKGGKKYIFLLENDKVKQIEVRTGISDEGLVEVVHGLARGQVVVVGGAQSLVADQPVKIKS